MVVKIILLQKVILLYGKRSLSWSLILFGYLSFTTVRRQKIGFNSCECIKFLNIANIHALDVWGKHIFICSNKVFFLCFFSIYSICNATFSTPVTSSKPATKLRYLRSSAFYSAPAFDITFQHETAFSLKSRNWPMNFAIFSNFRNPSCYFVSD